MFCSQCGAQLSDDSRYCYKCGAPTRLAEQKDSIEQKVYDPFEPAVRPAINHAPQQQAQQESHASNTTDEGIYAIIGFILAFFVPIVGLIFSIIGMTKKKNNGLATAGFVLSIILGIIYIVIIVIAVENANTTYPYYYYYY